jgi:class 3 adenylate cyclase
MIDAPTSAVTFLIADIEGSNSSSEKHPTSWMRDAFAWHDRILLKAAEDNGGYVIETLEETFCAAFATVKRALEATLTGQQHLSVALHSGVAEERDGDYIGQSVNRVARLLSADTHGYVHDTLGYSQLGARFRDLGAPRLEDPGSPNGSSS